jgi:hypothetical protein
MQVIPIVIIGIGLVVGFAVSALVAWKVWEARHHAALEPHRSIR